MNLSPETTHASVKLAAAFGLAYGADQLVFKRVNQMESATFATSVSLGVVAGDLVGGMFSKIVPDAYNGYVPTKTLVHRGAEVGTGVASAYVLNKYIFKNDFDMAELKYKLIIIAGVSGLSEVAADIFTAQVVSYYD